MTGVDYSDASMTDIAYTYNRLGQQSTVTDAAGTRTFAYNADFDLTSETIDGIYNKVLNRTYSTNGMKGIDCNEHWRYSACKLFL